MKKPSRVNMVRFKQENKGTIQMPLRDILDKTAHDIEPEDFDRLFCPRCKGEGKYSKSPMAMTICRVNVEVGIWGRDCRKQDI